MPFHNSHHRSSANPRAGQSSGHYPSPTHPLAGLPIVPGTSYTHSLSTFPPVDALRWEPREVIIDHAYVKFLRQHNRSFPGIDPNRSLDLFGGFALSNLEVFYFICAKLGFKPQMDALQQRPRREIHNTLSEMVRGMDCSILDLTPLKEPSAFTSESTEDSEPGGNDWLIVTRCERKLWRDVDEYVFGEKENLVLVMLQKYGIDSMSQNLFHPHVTSFRTSRCIFYESDSGSVSRHCKSRFGVILCIP
jgi:hypothetical protein